MAEQVSTTFTFTLPIDEIIEEAFSNIGGEHISGFDAQQARRALNMLMLDLQNREFPLAHLEKRSLTLTQGDTEYDLGGDVVAILDVNLIDTDTDTERQLYPMSIFDYFNLTGKEKEAPLSRYAFNSTTMPPKLVVYPAPEKSTYELTYWVMRQHKDITKSYQLLDAPAKYLPAITMGLSYFLAFKKKKELGISLDEMMTIKNEYEERLNRAFDADRDRNDVTFYPVVKRGD